MRFVSFEQDGKVGLGIDSGKEIKGFLADNESYPGTLESLISAGDEVARRAADKLASGRAFDPEGIIYRPPLSRPPKIMCVGLNYRDHAKEADMKVPGYPTFFLRVATTLVGHRQPMVRPKISDTFDYEGELVVVIGRGGRHIPKERALDHVFGYSIFNEGTVREYQFKAPQWTMGKNFDKTGGFGPSVVTADEVPPGATGLQLETRLNGKMMQSANTRDMVFDVASIISAMSEGITLEPGDVIVTGTAAGVGLGKKPPQYMSAGDVCEVEFEGIGVLINPIVDEA